MAPPHPPARPASSSEEDDATGDRRAIRFAIGLENGGFARRLLEEAGSIGEIKRVFDTRMRDELLSVQGVCSSFVADGRAGPDRDVRYGTSASTPASTRASTTAGQSPTPSSPSGRSGAASAGPAPWPRRPP